MANEFIARKGIISSGSVRITTGSFTSADFVSGSRGLFTAVTSSLFGTSSWAQTASVAYQVPAYLGSVAVGSTPYTGSFTGSFIGNGALLTNVGNCTISGSAPTVNVEAGDLWYEDTTGKTYVYYVSASVSSWVLQSDPTYVPDPTIQDFQDVTDIGSVTNNKITINNATESTSTGVGALLVAGGIGVGGNINAGGTVTEGSDERIKEDIQPITNALEIVKQLEGVKFRYKKHNEKLHIGLIAQRTLPVLPEIVHGTEEEYSIAYGNTVAILIEAIKEQQRQIDELKVKLAE